MKIIRSENLTYKYKKTTELNGEIKEETLLALNDVNISVEEGEFLVVLGHNGSGKSTFAKHINALLLPSEGTIWVNGIDTKNQEQIWDIRQTAGMVFQNPDNQLVATIVEEDIAFGPENMGIAPDEIRKRVDEALEAVQMSEFADFSPSKLSGGQKQRIAIAGVLAMKPKCIILDEPTAMLDPMGRKEVMKTIKKLNKEENITIILITHYMDEAVQGDRIYVIDDGVTVMEGTPKQIFPQVEKLKSFGLDVPQVTEVSFLLKQQGIDLPSDILTIDEMVGAICQLKSLT